MSAAVSPDGKYVLVLNGGFEPPSISVLEAASGREIGRTPVADAWLGLTFSPKGDRVYVGGGSEAAVFEFTFSAGSLAAARTFPVMPRERRTARDFIGDVTFDPAGHLLYAADLFRDSIVVINPQSGMVIERFATGRRPYRILFHPDGKSLFVSSWADGAVYHHETANGSLIDKVRLGPHPTDMAWLPGVPASELSEQKPAWVARLFVAAANTNNVYVVGVTEAQDLAIVETINVSMTAWQPAGMTPSALALGPDGKRLYIACSDANAVAVADVSARIHAGDGLHSHRPVSDGGARSGRRPPGGPERTRRLGVLHRRSGRRATGRLFPDRSGELALSGHAARGRGHRDRQPGPCAPRRSVAHRPRGLHRQQPAPRSATSRSRPIATNWPASLCGSTTSTHSATASP